jgi:hypothetical protein
VAWEKRKGSRNRYFYRSVRQGRRVVKQYFGKGLAGELAASLDATARREREQRAAAVRESRHLYEVALQPLAVLEDLLRALVTIELISAGYDYRHGRWRQRDARRNNRCEEVHGDPRLSATGGC